LSAPNEGRSCPRVRQRAKGPVREPDPRPGLDRGVPLPPLGGRPRFLAGAVLAWLSLLTGAHFVQLSQAWPRVIVLAPCDIGLPPRMAPSPGDRVCWYAGSANRTWRGDVDLVVRGQHRRLAAASALVLRPPGFAPTPRSWLLGGATLLVTTAILAWSLTSAARTGQAGQPRRQW
jgi:hypothetical protein